MSNDRDFEEFISYLATHEKDALTGKSSRKKKNRTHRIPHLGCSLSTFLHFVGISFIIFTFVKGSPTVGLLIILIYLVLL